MLILDDIVSNDYTICKTFAVNKRIIYIQLISKWRRPFLLALSLDENIDKQINYHMLDDEHNYQNFYQRKIMQRIPLNRGMFV